MHNSFFCIKNFCFERLLWSSEVQFGVSDIEEVVPKGLQLYSKEIPTQTLPCEYCGIFKNSYVEEPLRTATPAKIPKKIYKIN